MIIILGCGLTGTALAQALKRMNMEVTIVDKDPDRVEELKEQNFNAIVGDMALTTTLVKAGINKAIACVITISDIAKTKKTIETIKTNYPEVFVLAKASGPSEKEVLTKSKTDVVITPTIAFCRAVTSDVERLEPEVRFKKLRKILKAVKGKMAIVCHDNPDPDCLASALALKILCEYHEIECDVLYGGKIDHQQNRAFVNLLGLNLTHVPDKIDTSEYEKIAFIDHSGDNCTIMPEKGRVHIIIDHHQTNNIPKNVDFVDVKIIGATSTILTEYLVLAGIELNSLLATALMYGIIVDTANFRRGVTHDDIEVLKMLLEYVDFDVLDKVETSTISLETMDVLAKAIKNRRVEGSYLISNVGFVTARDSLPQAADYLLKLEGLSTIVIFGVFENSVEISARSNDVRVNTGEVMKTAFSDLGKTGGHSSSAGARIDLGLFGMAEDKSVVLKVIEEVVQKKFFAAIGKGLPEEIEVEAKEEEKK